MHLQSSDVSFAGKEPLKCQASLVKAITRVFGPYFVISVFFKLIYVVLMFVQPYLLGYVDDSMWYHQSLDWSQDFSYFFFWGPYFSWPIILIVSFSLPRQKKMILNISVIWKWRMIIAVNFKQLEGRSLKNIRASTGFERFAPATLIKHHQNRGSHHHLHQGWFSGYFNSHYYYCYLHAWLLLVLC